MARDGMLRVGELPGEGQRRAAEVDLPGRTPERGHPEQHPLIELDPIRESTLDFVDSLWTSRGGFLGSWADETLDCEYTYYGLLALGHLSV